MSDTKSKELIERLEKTENKEEIIKIVKELQQDIHHRMRAQENHDIKDVLKKITTLEQHIREGNERLKRALETY